MASASVALLGISNAIVDVLSQVQPADIEQIGAPPGSMTLIDQEKAVSLYASMQNKVESAGGSVANSVACFASLGGSAAYIGRVAEDELGNAFDADMRKLTIDMRLPPETRAAPTARSHIMITPNGERTMQTFLGACTEIAVSDMTEHTIGTPVVILLEGYVWDTPEGPAAMARAIELGKLAGARIALSLSDSFCVERHESAFTTLASGDADIIIGNEAEMLALFGVNTYSD
ncbi:MAG: adenosine kinase, partial [Pseudomonadota bacterium]